MTIENVINIEDARELRDLGLPIFPVVDASFSKAAERLFAKADESRITFYRAFVEQHRAPTPTRKRHDQMTKALARLASILNSASVYESPQESEEAALKAWFAVHVEPFVAFWNDVLANVENGQPITVTMTRETFDGWEVPSQLPLVG